MDSAMGSFTLHKNSAKPAVFLAGGIGVTPFSSIVRQADHDRVPHKLYLFYSNRRPEDAPFLEPLQKLDGDAALQEKVGRRDVGSTKKCCRDLLSNLQGPIYYIAGPPAMVTGMRK